MWPARPHHSNMRVHTLGGMVVSTDTTTHNHRQTLSPRATHAHRHTHARTHTSTHAHRHAHTLHTLAHKLAHRPTHARMHTHTHSHTYNLTHRPTHAHTHTHIHTRIPPAGSIRYCPSPCNHYHCVLQSFLLSVVICSITLFFPQSMLSQ